jgi:hypothetical protein
MSIGCTQMVLHMVHVTTFESPREAVSLLGPRQPAAARVKRGARNKTRDSVRKAFMIHRPFSECAFKPSHGVCYGARAATILVQSSVRRNWHVPSVLQSVQSGRSCSRSVAICGAACNLAKNGCCLPETELPSASGILPAATAEGLAEDLIEQTGFDALGM